MTSSNNFISASLFHKYASLLSKMLNLPESIKCMYNGKLREFTVFHRLEFLNMSSEDGNMPTGRASILVRSYPVFPNVEEGIMDMLAKDGFARIIPEFELSRNSIFWAGSPVRVFKDHQVVTDKRFGAFAFCWDYVRELSFPQFYVDYTFCLQEMTVYLDVLDRMEIPDTPKTFVGTVDDLAGEFRAPDGKVTQLPKTREQVDTANLGAGGSASTAIVGSPGTNIVEQQSRVNNALNETAREIIVGASATAAPTVNTPYGRLNAGQPRPEPQGQTQQQKEVAPPTKVTRAIMGAISRLGGQPLLG